MKLNPIKTNMTELELSNGVKVLFSYKTPVAILNSHGYMRTSKAWSKTTSRHINQWIGKQDAKQMPQEFFDALVKYHFQEV